LNHQLRQLGWPGVAGIGMLLFSASFYLSSSLPTAKEAALLRDSIASEMKNRSAAADQARNSSPGAQLKSFYDYFPPARQRPDQLARIYGFADKQGLQLQQGEYRLVQETNAKLERYQVTLPLRGSYTQVRQFVGEVLNEMPVVSLDDLKFEKQRIGDSAVDAQIRITLFLLADEKGKAAGGGGGGLIP
jgi:Tfp pilus assembly protein PilO